MVIHLGTRKYPYPVQSDPLQAVHDNILNTWDLFDMASQNGADLFLMVSSIGAAKPKNFMQASLRLAEYYLQSAEKHMRINSCIARLPNVADNPGCIVRAIQNQLRDGNRIILNHPAEQRYFSTVSTVAQFILLTAHMALNHKESSRNGIYMAKLNGSTKVLELARLICRDHGLDLEKDCEVEYIGADYPGLWIEEFQENGEKVVETPYKEIKRIIPSYTFEFDQVKRDIADFRELVERRDKDGVVELVNARVALFA